MWETIKTPVIQQIELTKHYILLLLSLFLLVKFYIIDLEVPTTWTCLQSILCCIKPEVVKKKKNLKSGIH